MAILDKGVEGIIDILPIEIVSKIDFLIILVQAIGGLAIIYIIFLLIRFYFLRKQTKILKAIKEDVEFIKKELKKPLRKK